MDRSDSNQPTVEEPQTVRTLPSSARSIVRSVLPSHEAVLPAALNCSPARDAQGSLARDAQGSASRYGALQSSLLHSPGPFVFDVGKMAFTANGRSEINGHATAAPSTKLFWPALQSQQRPSDQPWLANFVRTFLRTAGYLFAGWLAVILSLIVVFRFVDPPFSALMASHYLKGQGVHQAFVPLEAISPNVVRAVMLSEDGRFCEHWGVDVGAIEKAIARAHGGTPRGASTISMQVTKNLFLWPAKSYVRKFIEIPLTYAMELIWPKRRVMEIYLNIAEWGPGIFGVEAAARFHFNKPAARLTEREAAQLAVALPNPIQRAAGDPGPRTQRMAGDIQARMRAAPRSASRCVLGRI